MSKPRARYGLLAALVFVCASCGGSSVVAVAIGDADGEASDMGAVAQDVFGYDRYVAEAGVNDMSVDVRDAVTDAFENEAGPWDAGVDVLDPTEGLADGAADGGEVGDAVGEIGEEVCSGSCCSETCGNGVCEPECGEDQDESFCEFDCCVCGDGVCEEEHCLEGWGEAVGLWTCAVDCAVCGNNVCDPGEDSYSCPEDCTTACGNCECEDDEDYQSCPKDCGYCGDGYCINGCGSNPETSTTCPADCGSECELICGVLECGGYQDCFCGECDDGDLCTLNICNGANRCEYSAIDCNDGDDCTNDACDPERGCVNEEQTGTSCDDGNPCTVGDVCNEGICMAFAWNDCDDGIECTADACNPFTGCSHEPNDGLCDDEEECTVDTCEVEEGCRHWSREDGTSCGAGDHRECVSGVCQCIPQCGGRECGEDDCGGQCGLCEEHYECVSGVCDYVPWCGDGACNGDEDCEVCEPDCGCTICGEECIAGLCTYTACEDRDCGENICGGSCGTCMEHYECNDGTCEHIPWCGDGMCDEYEAMASCPSDCLSEGFVYIAAGSFWMGSPDGSVCPVGYTGGGCSGDGTGTSEAEPGRAIDETLHYVELTHGYELQAKEVTQGEWMATFNNWNPSYFSSCGSTCPVEHVTWYDAVAYANRKSLEAGYEECYVFSATWCEDGANACDKYTDCMTASHGGIRFATVRLAAGLSTPYECKGYRLPTEAEWENGARAGSLTAFYPSEGTDGTYSLMYGCYEQDLNLNQIAWYCSNAYGKSHGTGLKAANTWGLYDMSGNVDEWCEDGYGSYETGTMSSPLVDPVGPVTDFNRVSRGGGWHSFSYHCRSSKRNINSGDDRFSNRGFRLVRSE